MDDLKRIERKKQATLARRHIYTESKAPETFITSLSEEAREAFFASERRRIAAIAVTIIIMYTLRMTLFVFPINAPISAADDENARTPIISPELLPTRGMARSMFSLVLFHSMFFFPFSA